MLLLLLWCLCLSLFSLPPTLPSFSVVCLHLYSQSLQWRDWERVWWRTLATPLMKRKTTQPPKPQGQVTLRLAPYLHPQAGHRAIVALLHPHVLKHSHSRSLCPSGWHPKTGNLLWCVFFKFYKMFNQTEAALSHHLSSIDHREDSAVGPNGQSFVNLVFFGWMYKWSDER